MREGAALVTGSRTGRILLKGRDRRSYLQGLLTNDIETLQPGTGCYAAMLTAQVYKGDHFGMNTPGCDNQKFALNVMHWLMRTI